MNSLTLLSVEVRQHDGLFSLNDLTKAAVASGVKKDIRPNEWLSLDQTKGIAEILITENPASKPIVSKPGRYGGTYVCKELVYAYAMWISPKFNLAVIRAFDALNQPVSQSSQPRTLPHEVMKAINSKAHALSAGHYAGIRDAIVAHVLRLTGDDHDALIQAVNDYTETSLIPAVIGKRERLAGQRLMLRVSDDGASYFVSPIPHDCYVLSRAEIVRAIGCGQDLPLSTAELAEVIERASGRLARVLGHGRA